MKKKKNNERNEGEVKIILEEIFRLEKKMDKEFSGLHSDFNLLQEAVDNYAKKADTYFPLFCHSERFPFLSLRGLWPEAIPSGCQSN